MHFDGDRLPRGWFAVESMLGTGCVLKESESSNEYFRLSLTNSLLLIALAGRGFMGENLSTLAISERCHYCGIILKSPKRPRADEGSLLVGCCLSRRAAICN